MIEHSKFDHQVLQLRKIILEGVSYFIVWQALNREYENSIQTLDHTGFWWKYRGFFAPARNALLWSTLLQISKAYDKYPKTVSLSNLLVAARNNQKEFAPYSTLDSLEDIQARIAKNMNLLRRLRRYRNRRLVHYDSTDMQTIELPPEDVTALVEETKSIFGSLIYSCEGKTDDFNYIMQDVDLHTSQVISIMKAQI